jgi:hypothetical protein
MDFDRKENRRSNFNKKKFKKNNDKNYFSDYDEHKLKKAFKKQKQLLQEQELDNWEVDNDEIH